ncbi:hypothetical protein B0H34DRAFT_684248 [Crassisporium funariophilum]|nr:hypothetical protein B0H34DRAFT_684248 [Crassisporium funariophilum]
MNITTTDNPSQKQTNALTTGIQLNNEAHLAEQKGDLATAERLHLQAIAVKEAGLGVNTVTTALSYNALGELYLQMKKLDEAEKYLKKAVAIRNKQGPAFDGAVSREYLAELYELRGDLEKAKEVRLSGAPDKLACAYTKCPSQMFSLSQLKHCSRCKSVYYCSAACQTSDWKTRHKPLCKAT